MRVQFDLRPSGLVEKERKKTGFNLTRIIVLLLFIFFIASSLYYIVTMWMKMTVLIDDIDVKAGDLVALETQQTSLSNEVKRLQDTEKQYISTLQIMQDDLATLEVLNALETHMEWGIGLTSIRMTSAANNQYSAVVNATAGEEPQIIRLTDGLVSSGIFSSVTMPDSTLDERTNRITFTLNLSIYPIGQIEPMSN